MIKKVLTIAGSDCSGGAGIQADIKTITVHKMYAMSVITALTAQNTTGVYDIAEVTPEFVAKQMDCIFTDIAPDAVKIGMVANSEIIKVIAEKLSQYGARNIVVDPVMVSTSGHRLIDEEAEAALLEYLLSIGSVITPNIPEAEVLSETSIKNQDDMVKASKIISRKVNTAVLVKGGHLVSDASDLFFEDGRCSWYTSERIDNPNTHGTGCTLSAAIACNLASGKSLGESIKQAKAYLTGALRSNLDLGNGRGPLEHTYRLTVL